MNKTLITFFTLLFCLTSSVGWSETIDDLVKRGGIFYKKFTEVLFTGKVDGEYNGLIKNGIPVGSWVAYHKKNGQLWYKGDFKNGVRDGSWVNYYDNGQLSYKGNYKNGKEEGYWVWYNYDGNISELLTGTYKDGKRISD